LRIELKIKFKTACMAGYGWQGLGEVNGFCLILVLFSTLL